MSQPTTNVAPLYFSGYNNNKSSSSSSSSSNAGLNATQVQEVLLITTGELSADLISQLTAAGVVFETGGAVSTTSVQCNTLGVSGASTLTALSATSGTFTGALSVNGASTLGAVTASSLSSTGTLTVTGLTTAAAATFSGTVSGAAATFSGTVQASALTYGRSGSATDVATSITTLNNSVTSINGTLSSLQTQVTALPTTAAVTSAITTALARAITPSSVVSQGAISGSNLSASSTLAVTGAATLSSTLAVTGATTLTGGATLNSTLAVSGATTLSSTLGVTGATTLGALTANGAATLSSTLGVTGAATLSSTLGVTSAATLGSTLGVTGATTLSSTLAVTGTTTLTGAVTMNAGLTVSGSATVGPLSCIGALSMGDANLYTTISGTATSAVSIALPSSSGTIALAPTYAAFGQSAAGGGITLVSGQLSFASASNLGYNGTSYSGASITLPNVAGLYAVHVSVTGSATTSAYVTLTLQASNSGTVLGGQTACKYGGNAQTPSAQTITMNALLTNPPTGNTISFALTNMTSIAAVSVLITTL